MQTKHYTLYIIQCTKHYKIHITNFTSHNTYTSHYIAHYQLYTAHSPQKITNYNLHLTIHYTLPIHSTDWIDSGVMLHTTQPPLSVIFSCKSGIWSTTLNITFLFVYKFDNPSYKSLCCNVDSRAASGVQSGQVWGCSRKIVTWHCFVCLTCYVVRHYPSW